MTFFENRVFAGRITGRIKVSSSWISVGPKANESVLRRDRKGHTGSHRDKAVGRWRQRLE